MTLVKVLVLEQNVTILGVDLLVIWVRKGFSQPNLGVLLESRRISSKFQVYLSLWSLWEATARR